MNSRNFIKICLVTLGVVIVAALIASLTVYEEDIPKKLQSEKDITFIKTSIPFGESNIYNRIYIIHDNERNVTCYLYNDGISCIPDCYIENKGGELYGE